MFHRNPNAVVLEQKDVEHPDEFVKLLADEPYNMQLQGPKAWGVRQVFVSVRAPTCTRVPHVCDRALAKHAAQAAAAAAPAAAAPAAAPRD